MTGERAMSPAQSEDSGLAADRGTTYATISLPRENAQAMGIVFLGKFFVFLGSDHTNRNVYSAQNLVKTDKFQQ